MAVAAEAVALRPKVVAADEAAESNRQFAGYSKILNGKAVKYDRLSTGWLLGVCLWGGAP